MKAVGIILIILCIAALGGMVYMYFHASVSVSYIDCIASDPLDDPEEFERIKRLLENNAYPGVVFSKEPLKGPEDYIYYTWTVRVDNDTLLTAKAVELQVTPMGDDVLLVSDGKEHIIKSNSSAFISVTFLSKRTSHNIREANVTWYLGGLHFPTVPISITMGR